MENHKKVEAVLFAAGKEVAFARICELTNLEEKAVEQALVTLQSTYEELDRSFHLVKRPLGWKLTVKDEYLQLVSSLVPMTEVDRPLMETLAVIAWRYPIIQSEIVKLRGPAAYDHMRALVEMGFIAKERFGRTYKVKLTKKFFSYFDLPSEKAKKAFLEQVPQQVLQDAEDVDKEADEVERLKELHEQEKQAQDEISKAMDQAQG